MNNKLAIAPGTAGRKASASRLRPVAQALAHSRSLIDHAFFTMGEQLTGCVRLLMEISLAQGSIPSELNGPEFLAATKALGDIRKTGQQLADSEPEDNERLQQLNKAVTALADPLATLRRAISTIQLIAVNAKIVAAGVQRKRPGFGTFATDMLQLGREAASEINAFAMSYDHLLSCLKAAMRAGAAFRERHSGTMAKITERIEEHLTVIAHHRARAEGKAQIYDEANRRITGRISDAVAAIQIGDITRQRVEHVELALDMLGWDVAVPENSTFLDDAGTVALLAHLASSQLNAAASDFEHEMKQLTAALHHLGADTAAMLRDNSREAENLLSAGGTALGAVIQDMLQIEALLRDFGEMRAGLAAVAGEVAHSVEIMVTHLDTVRKIEQEIHLLSLNTAVQCNQLGLDGRALLVIAQDLRALAGETASAARLIMTGLGDAQLQTKVLIEAGTVNAGNETGQLGELAIQVVSQLGTVADHLRQHVGTVVKTGPEAARLLDNAASSAERHRKASAEWRRVQQTIASYFPHPEMDEAVDAEIFARLRGHYTMDSERELHDRIVGLAPQETDAVYPVAISASDGDSVLF